MYKAVWAAMAVVMLVASCKTAATDYAANTVRISGSETLTIPKSFTYLGEIKNYKAFADTSFNRALLKGNFKIAMHVYAKDNSGQGKEADEVIIINTVAPVSPRWILLCYNINDQEYLSDRMEPVEGTVGGFIQGKGYETKGPYAFVMRKASCDRKKLFRVLYGVNQEIQVRWSQANRAPGRELSERVSAMLP